jgi:hypothetical protein
VLVFLLVFLLATTGLLAAWSLWFQSYIYEKPADGLLQWRAPAAGAGVTAFVALWALLAHKADHRLGLLVDVSPRESYPPVKELWATDKEGHKKKLPDGKEAHYKLVGSPPEFRLNGTGDRLPRTPDGILIVENGAEVVFLPERDAQGNFKRGEVKSMAGSQTQPILYKDPKGRVIEEGQFQYIGGRFRFGWFLANLALNVLFLAAWLAALWLLLEFQFWHALGQAVVVWLALELFVLGHLIS